MDSLQKEYEYYLANQEELAKKYAGKVLAIKECSIIGVFDSELEAWQKTSQTHEKGSFLIQQCDSTGESYTQTYHSRVFFA